MVPLNDLSRGWLAKSPEVREAVSRVMASGWYLNGPELAAFEGELAAYLGIKHAIGVASGTDALALALQAVGCGRGSEVVTAANAGGYTSVAAVQIGADVAYADVDGDTLLVTTKSVEAALGPTTKAVVVTHLYGNVAKVDEIAELCRGRRIALIEDCAQSLGATLDGRKVGSFGDIATISFYPTKNLGAAGDAGAIVTANDALADAARSLRQYGWGAKYRIVRADGRNSRLDELQAAILRVGLSHLDELSAHRREIVGRYAAALPASVGRMVSGATTSHVAHLAVARVNNRDDLRRQLKDAGVATDIHYPIPDHLQAGLPNSARATDLSETERAAAEILTLPCFPEMTGAEIERVCTALRAARRG
jgi:dTDP-3-amino-2,3,6-trideoxy-4-keto-D-glucose/dTDP-3-amino-3,4,6-trideoxy-alpha-D-glucose/dTDP-2,6-dideoxy-D-kanosamine transaminase